MFITNFVGKQISIVGFQLVDDTILVFADPETGGPTGAAQPILDERLACLLEYDGTRYDLGEFSRRFLEEAFFSDEWRRAHA